MGRGPLLLLLTAAPILLAACGEPPQPVASVPPFTAEQIARGRERFLTPGGRFGCLLCHGRDLEGGNMGPPLEGIGSFYRSELNGEAPARARIRAHLRDPLHVPALRRHPREYLAPMPPYEKLNAEELETLTAFLMSLE